MFADFMNLGGVEIFNSARLEAYLASVGHPLDSVGACGCPTFTAEHVGDEPYTTPWEDEAPWWDEDVPESSDFAGLLVLDVEGMDDHPVTRSVTGAVTGGAALGAPRVQPRTITVTGVLLGATCCGVAYGLRWLSQALSGCGDGCGGDCLTVYNCCPPETEDIDEFVKRNRRTLRRVALVDGPRVIARNGNGCTGSGMCQSGADVLTVEFVLTAGTPWLWTDPVPVLDLPVPTDDGTECITWCIHRGPEGPPDPVCIEPSDTACATPGAVTAELTDAACEVAWPALEPVRDPCDATCRLAACPDPEDLCGNPSCKTPTPPVLPPPETCFRHALAVNTETYELDLSSWPRWFGAVPVIEVSAGSSDLRRVTITLYERTAEHAGLSCDEVVELERCNPHSTYEIAFVAAGGVMTLDGQVGRATVECLGRCEGTTDAYGRDGGPLAFPLLTCDRYCVEVAADAIVPPAPDATVTVSLSGREY
ncbi:hypothetical protein GCM10010207_84900 [Streptomyces atratus]|uniref:hypothetical protein n=1 Tax=Streptomyces atratus TaxID=1893 RepID=UPI0016718916|nr:hypothetical protein [Streptomyces atratus]GGT74517.1 hypothetical protein GCM10010207_84900 [Streptomyces atratus]